MKQELSVNNDRLNNTEKIKWGICLAAAVLLIVLSAVLLRGDAYVFWTWWLLAFILGAVFMPLTSILFGYFEDKGWFFSKILGIACCGFAVWFLCTVKIIRFTTLTCWAVCLAAAGLMLALAHKKDKSEKESLPWDHFRLVFTGELVFIAAFLLWTYLAGMNPNAYGTEKFMDYGFMEAMMRSKTLPAVDMWYSGGTINYYYGGQYFAVFLTKLSGSRVEVTYNLMRTFVAGLAFILPCSLVFQMMRDEEAEKKIRFSSFRVKAAGALAGTAVSICGNMHYVVYRWVVPFISHLSGKGEPSSYWFPDATRYIGFNPDVPDKTIHEFPCYSFVLGDLHAHVINIIFVLLLIGILYAWSSSARKAETYIDGTISGLLSEILQPSILFAGFLLAVYQLNNYWDYVIYFVVTAGVLLFSNITRQKSTGKIIYVTALETAVFTIVSQVLILPFTLTFKTMVSGVALCQHHSLPHQLLVLWGLPCFVSIMLIIALVSDRKKTEERGKIRALFEGVSGPDMFAVIIALCSIGLVLIPEIVYVRDIYESGNARANTMFKLTYQAFIMFGIVMGYGVIRLIMITRQKLLKTAGIISLILLLWTALYAGKATQSWFADSIKNVNYRGLYALGYLDIDFLEDAGAVYWLKDNIEGSPVVLEANGDSYTAYNRVSASTGLPTPLGWYVHEWLWRSDTDDLNRISADIETIYTSDDPDVVKNLLKEYNVSYIFVGKMEEEKYGDALQMDLLRTLGNVVYTDEIHGTFIVKTGGE